jgi:hypothetical protein
VDVEFHDSLVLPLPLLNCTPLHGNLVPVVAGTILNPNGGK